MADRYGEHQKGYGHDNDDGCLSEFSAAAMLIGIWIDRSRIHEISGPLIGAIGLHVAVFQVVPIGTGRISNR